MARKWIDPGAAVDPGDHDTVCCDVLHDQLAAHRDPGSRWRKAVRIPGRSKIDRAALALFVPARERIAINDSRRSRLPGCTRRDPGKAFVSSSSNALQDGG